MNAKSFILTSTFAVLFAVALSAGAESDAEAGGGWYLLEPPGEDMIWEDSMPSVRTDSQLSRWSHLGSYDTAAECETGKQKHLGSVTDLQMALDKQWAAPFPKGLPKVKEEALGFSFPDALEARCVGRRSGESDRDLCFSFSEAMAARCVASDDPRLLGK